MLCSCLLLLGLLGVGNAAITDCSNGASVLKLTTLTLSPDPPVRNQNLDMGVVFNNPGAPITDGTVTTSVTLNWIPFQPTVEPLCTNTQCPLETGSNDRSTSSVWPDTVSGNVVSKIEWTGVDGSQLLCIKISTKVAANETVQNYLRGSSAAYSDEEASEVAEVFSYTDDYPWMDSDSEEQDGINKWALYVPEEWAGLCFPEDQWYEEFLAKLDAQAPSIGWSNATRK
jgi:hypothetical protein